MPPHTIYIYEVAHGADPVESHLDELRQWNIAPDFIGLEQPNEDSLFGPRELLKSSPGLYVALKVVAKFHMWLISKGSSTASRSDAEFEAGRQFSSEVSADVDEVDLDYEELFSDYITRYRQVWDAVLLVSSFLLVVLSLAVLVYLVIRILDGGSISELLIEAIVAIVIAVLLGVFSLANFSKIVNDFGDGVRDIRNEAIFNRTLTWCESNECGSALIIAGKKHSGGLSNLAKSKGIEVQTRSAPAVKNVGSDSISLIDIKRMFFE